MKIFPKEILEYSTHYYLPRIGVKNRLIYGTILLTCVALLSSLPFLTTPIYSSARGYITSNRERVILHAVSSGKVTYINLNPNAYVQQGDTLLIVQNHQRKEQRDLLIKQKEKLLEEKHDLQYLLSRNRYVLNNLVTPIYQKQLIAYYAVWEEHQARLKKLKLDFDRNQQLYEKGVIARAEFENVTLEYDLAKSTRYQHQKQQINTWQARSTELENALQELESELAINQKNEDNFIVTAPIKGAIINVTGLDHGSFVSAGTQLAEISPKTDLIAECYVSPRDIGLLDPDKKVRFQIDAFNYNQWGTLNGTIISKGKDVEFFDQKPLYRIQCSLEANFLQLKNGYKGSLGKGMTLNARFELAERTLYQLLYDKVDDWINPGNPNDKTIAINQ